MTPLDEKIARQVDLQSMLSAYLNGLEDARDGHAPQTRYVGLSWGHEQAYGEGYHEGCRLLRMVTKGAA